MGQIIHAKRQNHSYKSICGLDNRYKKFEMTAYYKEVTCLSCRGYLDYKERKLEAQKRKEQSKNNF